jgi:hypothetical protein
MKELEAVLRTGEGFGWVVTRGGKYFKMKCPCGDHLKMVHMTPSDPRYLRNLVKHLGRTGCWKEQGS